MSQRREFDPGTKRDVPGQDYSLQDRDYKTLYRTEGPDGLFYIRAEPYEKTNLADVDSERHFSMIDEIRRRVEQYQANNPDKPFAVDAVDQDMRDKLQALGYID